MAQGEKTIATNRKARHEFFIEEKFEAGLVLKGSEVKSLRAGRANIQEAYCVFKKQEIFLLNCHISPYQHGGTFTDHEPLRERKLLLNRREIRRLQKAVQQKGYTIVPLRLYFKTGLAKMEIGLARGKKQYDKRSDIAERETKRRLDRLMRER